MIAKPMSLLGSAGSNLTTNSTPFSAHESIIWEQITERFGRESQKKLYAESYA